VSKAKEEPTGHQPPAEPLPDIYESPVFTGAWYCSRCSTHFDRSNVEPHRARHEKEDAIAEASKELLRACQELTEDDLAELLRVMFTHPIERLVAAIRARRALD
jgi:hypothetical protein